MCVLGRPMFNQRFIPHKESFNKILKKNLQIEQKMSIVLHIPSLIFMQNDVTTNLITA